MTRSFAAELAQEAGALLVRIRAAAAPHEIASRELKDRGDAAAQAYLAGRLRDRHPDDAVLSEEAPDHAGRLTADRVWIIDPLDGTREFAEGRHDWAVHVALWQDGELAEAAVALPAIDTMLTTEDPPVEPTNPIGAKFRLAVSRSRPPALVDRLVDLLGCEVVPMGSAGFKVGAVIRGEADAYVHAGGQFEWDSAAPVAVARHAGMFTSRIDGSPLRYNRPDPALPDLVVCRPEIASLILDTIEQIRAEEAE